jgi:hypothetical protein
LSAPEPFDSGAFVEPGAVADKPGASCGRIEEVGSVVACLALRALLACFLPLPASAVVVSGSGADVASPAAGTGGVAA